MAGIQAGGASAGRLSIEIVAEIARLQSDLDKAKRMVRDASGDIAKSTKAANDNLAVFGSGLNRAGGASKLAGHHVQNLAFQFQDLGVQMFAAAGSSAPLKMAFTALIQQGSQIQGIMSQAGIGFRGLAVAVAGMLAPFAPLIAIVGAAAVVFALFNREINSDNNMKKYADGLGLSAKEMKKLTDVTVTWEDTAKAVFQVGFSNIAARFGMDVKNMSNTWTNFLDGMTYYAKEIIANLYADFAAGVYAINNMIQDIRAGKKVDDPFTAWKTGWTEAKKDAVDYMKDVGGQATKNAKTRLDAQAAALKANRTPKTDKHAEQLAREAAAIEAQIRNLYGLQQAYKLSGGAALIAEARVKAESDAIKKRADIAAAVDRQVRLSIAQRTADGQKAEQAMDEQARIQEQVNAQVAAGLVPAQRANELVQNRMALLPLLGALEAAEMIGNEAATRKAQGALDDLSRAQERIRKAQATSAFNNALADGRDQIAILQEELRLVTATEMVRERSLRLKQAELFAGRQNWDAQQIADYVTQQAKLIDGAQAVAVAQNAWNESLSRFGDIAARADDTARSMANSFGDVGSAIGDAISILGRYGEEQAQINELVRNGQRSQAWGVKQSTDLQLNSMIGLSRAARGFFDENSKGYKVMMAAEQALTVVQLARTAVDVAGGAARMFASLGPWAFPAVGAMLGVMAALGFGGGTSTNFTMPKNEGTGTVLGDSSAKSESIKRSIDQLKDVDLLTNSYSREMMASLKSIDSQIGSFASVLVRNSDSINASGGVSVGFQRDGIGSALNSIIGGSLLSKVPIIGGVISAIGNFVGNLFGARYDITGSGFYGGAQSLGSIKTNGYNGQYYSDVMRTKKTFGIVTGRSSWTDYTDADPALENQFTLILRSFNDAIAAAAGPLGVATSVVEQRLNSFVVDIGKIDLQGLNGEQIQEKLTAVFGALGDRMADAVFPGMLRFQKVGEGAFETLVRVASTVESVTTSLDLLGVKSTYLGLDLKMALADQFDSLSDMASVTQSYFEAYYSKEEQAAARTKQFVKIFDSMGLTMPSTLAGFRQMVEAQDLATAAGQATYATLLQLAPAFADLQSAMNGAKSAADILSERQDLQRKLLELNGDTAAIRALDLANLDASNRALQEQVWAVQDAQEAATAAQQLKDAWTSVGDSIMDEVKRIRGLVDAGGDNSFATLLGQFNAATSAARGGDQTAAKSLTGLSQALLTAAGNSATSKQELTRVQAQTAASLEQTYSVIQALIGSGASTPTADTLASAATAGQTATASGSATSDMVTELKALRAEVSQMRSENNSGHASNASANTKAANILERVTGPTGGDAVQVSGRAA